MAVKLAPPPLTVPDSLKTENRWVMLRTSQKPGEPKPDLFQPSASGFQIARFTDPRTWGRFEDVLDCLGNRGSDFYGVGIINSRYNPIITMRFKGANTSEFSPSVLRYLEMLNTYTMVARDIEGNLRDLEALYRSDMTLPEPIKLGNLTIAFRRMIEITGMHIAGSPLSIRTNHNQLEGFIKDAKERYQNYLKSRSRPDTVQQDNLTRLLSRLQGVRVRAAGRQWMARCPNHNDGTPSLSINLTDEGKILMHCFHCGSGAKKDILAKLGLGLGDLMYSDKPIELATLPQTAAPKPRNTAQIKPLEGDSLATANQALERLKSMRTLPEAFRNRGFTLADAIAARLGAISDTDGAIVAFDLQDRPLNVKVRTGPSNTRATDRFYSATRNHGSPPWISPNFTQSAGGVMVVEGETNAVGAWTVFKDAGIGVIGVGGVEQHLDPQLLFDLAPQAFYLYVDPSPSRPAVLDRWKSAIKQAGHSHILLLDPLGGTRKDGKDHDFNSYAAEHGLMGMVDRLVHLMEAEVIQ